MDPTPAIEEEPKAVAWDFKTIPFNIGAFILPFFFMLHFKKQRQAWGYFILHFIVNILHVDLLIIALELIVGIIVGVKANEIMQESGKIETADAYKKSYIRWAVAGILLAVIAGLLLSFAAST